ncbi:exoribonuclease II [Thorsellia anophelis]|uniref:Exoribonuclease II n=1 Tax=Thorsellia anophelis DSM 18579 TaxID=1123402 RepID=A0A1I0CM88_9GAMM|nr:exoribonuclease II [Thorsellia anophelis]SET20334.1 exoribonuclease-2 [Thorsellia anophelis DSM 18579]
MFQNNPLLAQLKQQLHVEIPVIEGLVKGTAKGYGFLEVDAQTSHFIPPPQMKKVMHGDRVTVTLKAENGKEFAEIETLITPSLDRFIARVVFENNRLAIIPDHPQINQSINARLSESGKTDFHNALIAKGIEVTSQHQLKDGDWVVAKLTNHPLGLASASQKPAAKNQFFFAEIIQFITFNEDPLAPWWVTLADQDLPRTAPVLPEQLQTLLAESSAIAGNEPSTNYPDMTDMCFFTIDSESTFDMDDALNIRAEGEDLILTVAISNPTEFITKDSELDLIAKERGFTHYLPGFNVPMLPRELADNYCSLLPNEHRKVLACEMKITQSGSIEKFHFFTALIESKYKLSYTQISDYLEMKGDWMPDNLVLQKQISLLADFTKRRQAWREKNALIFNEKPEYRFVLGDEGTVTDIVIEDRRISNKMVEESMLAANLCAADFLTSSIGYGLFNVHEGFDKEQIESAVKTLTNYEISCEAERLLTLDGFCELKRRLLAEPTELIDSRLRRFQSIAEIRTTPGPHFGLGFKGYATWTSPIRKYSDIINHRLIKAILTQSETEKIEDTLCEHLMACRKTSRQAERFIANWLYARFLAPFAGTSTQFKGEVIDINRAGMRIKLVDNGAIGFIPNTFLHDNRDEIVSFIDDGYIEIKATKVYSLGDVIDVVIQEVREESRSIIFNTVKMK